MSVDRPRIARLLLIASALGEMGVGVLGLAFPQIVGVLLDVELDRAGSLVTRMLAVAVLAVAVTWWLARNDPQGVQRNAAGFLVYNFGIGALFVYRGLEAAHPAVPLVLGVIHIGAGLAFLALARAARP